MWSWGRLFNAHLRRCRVEKYFGYPYGSIVLLYNFKYYYFTKLLHDFKRCIVTSLSFSITTIKSPAAPENLVFSFFFSDEILTKFDWLVPDIGLKYAYLSYCHSASRHRLLMTI